jgi:hypothetical protein
LIHYCFLQHRDFRIFMLVYMDNIIIMGFKQKAAGAI